MVAYSERVNYLVRFAAWTCQPALLDVQALGCWDLCAAKRAVVWQLSTRMRTALLSGQVAVFL